MPRRRNSQKSRTIRKIMEELPIGIVSSGEHCESSPFEIKQMLSSAIETKRSKH
jgi:hypothetical protein